MKCHTHYKELTHRCAWCGRNICTDCIISGKEPKVYCDKCSDKLSEV